MTVLKTPETAQALESNVFKHEDINSLSSVFSGENYIFKAWLYR